MKRGPPRAELGTASCPSCDDAALTVATNKHGFPGAYCRACETQFQPRGESGSTKLLARIHRWTNPEAAELMLDAGDVAVLQSVKSTPAPQLPPHLARLALKTASTPPRPRSPKSTPAPPPPAPPAPTPPAPPAPTPPAKKSWWDREL